jgi:hypothetical protein
VNVSLALFFIVSTLKSNFVKVIYYFRFAENVFQGAAEKEKKYLGVGRTECQRNTERPKDRHIMSG